jgi:hypothetical protein
MPSERSRKGGSEKPDGDTGPAEQNAPEFDRFKDLARKLIQVPKKELDAKRKAKR